MSVKIIAHRGWWKTPEEQNTLTAFARAFDAGIGVELDVRDWCDRLVVAHDPPGKCKNIEGEPGVGGVYAGVFGGTFFNQVLDLLGDRPNILAVNVKSCGLAPWFAQIEKKPANWFFFDLPPHEDKEYLWFGLPVCRADSMNEEPAFMISEEVHRRPDRRESQWLDLRRHVNSKILLCTDLIEEAGKYFGGLRK